MSRNRMATKSWRTSLCQAVIKMITTELGWATTASYIPSKTS